MDGSAPAHETIRHEVAPAFLDDVLRPYKPHCRYLRAASFELPRALAPDAVRAEPFLARLEGRFAIPESCYIDDTGHLNAVEFNICYNQMLYTIMAQSIVHRAVPALKDVSLEEFRRRQLPDVLIHGIRSTFKRVIDARGFSGHFVMEEAARRRRFILFRTRCRFWDDRDGLSEGRVDVVLLDREAGRPRAAGA